MKPDNWNRFAAVLLAILLCLCSFSMPAFASGTDYGRHGAGGCAHHAQGQCNTGG